MNESQIGFLREKIQEKIPDKKVRNIWYLSTAINGDILYGVSTNNNAFFAVAEVDINGNITIRR